MVTITLDINEAMRGMELLLEIVEEAVPEAIHATLQRVAAEAISIAGEVVPVDTGALRDSIHMSLS